MKAAVMRSQKAPLEIEEIEIDDPGPGEVLIKTAASGICHSDLHVIEGDLPIPPPCVLGHEPAGIVEVIGEGVTDFVPGDHVIGCITQWCGVCKFCTHGRPYLCLTQFKGRPEGATPRISASGEPITQFANLSSFADHMLSPERRFDLEGHIRPVGIIHRHLPRTGDVGPGVSTVSEALDQGISGRGEIDRIE